MLQLVFACFFCYGLHASGKVTFQSVSTHQIKMYSLYGLLFVGSVYSSMKSLEGSNVETQIVFRSATPLAVSVLDAFLLGRELPSRRSIAVLAIVACGAAAYVATDAEFLISGWSAYGWVFFYYWVGFFLQQKT